MENCAQGEPLVRPKNTWRAFFKHFRCSHHWVFTNTGTGEQWRQCSVCKWRSRKDDV